jgi:ATP-dependent DNA helicase RecG
MLLFAKEPIRHHIHIGRFKTPSMIIDDRQFTDTLFEVVDQSMKFIISYISVAFEFDGSIQRKERFAYPLPALREALLNAVIHRNYTDGSDIQIKIFDDKISIFSPGTFYGGISVADIQVDNYCSSLRNKLIAEGFYLTGSIEKYGSGFIRIRKALQDYPEIDFEIKEFAGGMMVTFAQREGVNVGVNVGVNGLLSYVRSHPGQRAGEMAVAFNLTQRTIERWLKQLKENGSIEFRGAAKTGGYYYLDADE